LEEEVQALLKDSEEQVIGVCPYIEAPVIAAQFPRSRLSMDNAAEQRDSRL
jgi:hypothetical protein